MPAFAKITAMLAVLSLMSGVALAQDDERESCSVCEFEGETIVGSIESYREFLDRMADSEVPLREYTQASIASIERGSSQAVTYFGRWYTYKVAQQNAREIENRLIAEIVGQGLQLGLAYFLPPSGAVAAVIRSYGSQTYGALVGRMPDGTTDPGPHLQRIGEDMEFGTDRLQDFVTDMFHGTGDQALRDQMDMIKMEYVWEKGWQREEGHPGASTRSPGDDTRRLLREIGIGPGGEATTAAVRERVLKKLIKDALCIQHQDNPVLSCESEEYLVEELAHGMALRLIAAGDPTGMYSITDPEQLGRICAVEPSHWYYQSQGCQR